MSKPGEHQMEAIVQSGMNGWVWTSPSVRFSPPLTNPVWIAINMLFRARGLRLGSGATTLQLDLAETQFKFRGTVQEEKPLRGWIQEVLINCLGFYTFSFGKLKVGVRVNSSAVESFTEGNILFRTLKLAPLKPSFNHITAHFADEDFEFVANSVAVYDVD
ncbi:MAG: hypothetical protein HY235_25155, partial [Acidobacteria bacterium]|nr:hypothetical protein [Acidobacteriota bacterium]